MPLWVVRNKCINSLVSRALLVPSALGFSSDSRGGLVLSSQAVDFMMVVLGCLSKMRDIG